MRRRDRIAALIAIAIGAPLVFLWARALADGVARYQQGPLRRVLGNETYEKLRAGHKTPRHYLGDELLAPDFTLPDRHGDPWKLGAHRGKLVVLNFWTVDCQPCVEEMPTLVELGRMARHWPDVEVVTVSTDEGWAQAKTVLPENPPFHVLFDPEEKVVEDKFGTRLYPETWIIDEHGVIRMRYDGQMDWSSPLAVEVINRFR